MKYIKLLFYIVIVSMLLCGCQDTPEQVKENMKEYGDNVQVKNSEVSYCSPEELKKTKMPNITGSNLTFPDKVDFSHVEGVDLLHLSLEKNFLTDKNIEKYCTLFGVNKNKLKKDSGAGWGETLTYDNEKELNYMNMMENGGLVSLKDRLYQDEESVVEKRYNIDTEDISDVNVNLADKTESLSKVCENMRQWMEKYMHIEGIRYRISDAYIRKVKKDQSGKRLISLCAEYDYKGIPFNNHTPILTEEDKDFEIKELTTWLSAQLGVSNSQSPSYFSRNMNVSIDSTESVKKVIDLKSAITILKEKLSGFGVFHVSKILPLYELKLEDKSEAPGAKIEARPVYAFLVGEKQDDTPSAIIKTNNCDHYFLVDMVTGQITTDLEIKK